MVWFIYLTVFLLIYTSFFVLKVCRGVFTLCLLLFKLKLIDFSFPRNKADAASFSFSLKCELQNYPLSYARFGQFFFSELNDCACSLCKVFSLDQSVFGSNRIESTFCFQFLSCIFLVFVTAYLSFCLFLPSSTW